VMCNASIYAAGQIIALITFGLGTPDTIYKTLINSYLRNQRRVFDRKIEFRSRSRLLSDSIFHAAALALHQFGANK